MPLFIRVLERKRKEEEGSLFSHVVLKKSGSSSGFGQGKRPWKKEEGLLFLQGLDTYEI